MQAIADLLEGVMNATRRIPVFNGGPDELVVGLELEGDCIALAVGESLEILYSVAGGTEPEIEIEVEGRLLSVHVMVDKEVLKGGRKVR